MTDQSTKPTARAPAGAVRAGLAALQNADGLAPVVVTPVDPTAGRETARRETHDGTTPPDRRIDAGTVDGTTSAASLAWSAVDRARLSEPDVGANGPIDVILEPPRASRDGRGAIERDVLVGGWRIVVEVESERHAALREQARRSDDGPARGAASEVRAIIPGRVVSVAVQPGDIVSGGQRLVVVEAMKMQNEVRAPRDGTVARLAVAPDDTIDAGDLLLVLE